MGEPITGFDFLTQELEWGMSADNLEFINLAKLTIDQVADIDIKTVLDYGAGVGVYAEQARLKGYDVYAYDIWESHRNYMADKFPELKQTDKPVTTDLMLFIEVAEHMTDDEVKQLLEQVHPKYILFSACNTHSDIDEYWGHINIKQPEAWHEVLAQYGYEVIKQLNLPTDHTFLYGSRKTEKYRIT